ncbi:MAG: sulfotransferase family 2 domain-containing protein [Chloroflexi bacterium]|nr:sulfotransferase family 2 domain-containing protein [Chloroflexota bacterium]
MIISDRYRYLFVELPRTGSTAVHRELCSLYGGEAILTKHATYEDFLAIATNAQKAYFVFSSVRNPMDDAVTRYFKVRGGRAAGARKGNKDRVVNRIVDTHMTRFVGRTNADFATFFLRYYIFPYDTWASLSHKNFDFVMRFENLVADFEQALHLIGLEPQRSLPVANRTADRRADYAAYYTPITRRRARRVLGPYMAEWGYQLPAAWGSSVTSTMDRWGYGLYSFFACLYWRYVRRAR